MMMGEIVGSYETSDATSTITNLYNRDDSETYCISTRECGLVSSLVLRAETCSYKLPLKLNS